MDQLIYSFTDDGLKPVEEGMNQSRAFLYGDGCFETVLVKDGTPVFWEEHLSRLKRTLAYLEMEALEYSRLKSSLVDLIDSKGVGDARLRLTVYRAGNGRYCPESSRPELDLQFERLDRSPFNRCAPKRWDKAERQHTPIYHDRFKLIDKHRQVLYAKEAERRSLDDLVIRNTSEALVGTVSGNVYVLMDGHCYTPTLESGCLEGTIRTVLLENGLTEERMLDLSIVDKAEGLFTTNSIEGIRMLDLGSDEPGQLMELKTQLDQLVVNSIRGFQEIQP